MPPIGRPSNTIFSGAALRSPVTVFRKVDLPAPFAPMIPTASPAWISKSMPKSAWKSP
jgi:hypothetical protein